MNANPIETDIQLAIMVGNRAFREAAEYAIRTSTIRSSKPGKTRRLRMRAIVAIIREAAFVPAARPDAIAIYRAHRPKLDGRQRHELRLRLGEDFDVLPVDESDVVDQLSLDGENPVGDADVLSAARLPPPPPGSPRRLDYELDRAFDGMMLVEKASTPLDAWEDAETDPLIKVPVVSDWDDERTTERVVLLSNA